MATKTTSTRTTKTTRAARSTARKASGTGKQAARTTGPAARTTGQATRTAEQAERTVRELARDGAYAALGVGDSAVGLLRSLPRRAGELPGDVRSAVGGLVTTAGKGLDSYARRGRGVARSITGSRPTRRAVAQGKVARSQVKAATTSVRKAVDEGVDAAGSAAGKVGDDQRR